tara:strand:- start:48 stop:797 length:750 start_codon:yes stop_codon:yes gene_type:complete
LVEQVEIKTEEATAEKPEVVETPTTEARPEWLPEKFSSAEDLAKAYSELETKQSQKVETTPEATPEATTESNDLEIDQAADNAVQAAGLNMEELQNEYDTNGTLNEESFAALEKAGISKDYVDAFIAGQEAIANNIGNEVRAGVGGNESYNELVSWAKDSLQPNEIAAYNDAVNSGNLDTIKLAVGGLKARYDSANGTEPQLVSGKNTPDAANGFESWAQLTEAMKDARYAKDPAYRAEIQKKLSNSSI